MFDVFLAHNSKDKPLVREIYQRLKELGLNPWLDEEHIPPGTAFQDEIQQAIAQVKTAAIFLGKTGLGRWQALELKSFITQCVERNIPVIPVLLPGVSGIPDNLPFLKEFHAVSFGNDIEDTKAFDLLYWGITRKKANEKTHNQPSSYPIQSESSSESGSSPLSGLNILHLSDLRFGTLANARDWYKRLSNDLKNKLNCSKLDILIISGDITNKSTTKEYEAAKHFLESVCREFHLNSKQIVIVPGERDVNLTLAKQSYRIKRFEEYRGPIDNEGKPDNRYAIYKEGQDHIEVLSQEKYKQRFKNFSTFYEALRGEPYPSDYAQQASFHHFPEHNLLILGLNSAWEIDHHYTSRISVHSDALNKAIEHIHQNPEVYKECLKFAVWHHPLSNSGKEQLKAIAIMQKLAQAGFCTVFCGHISKAKANDYRPEPVGVGDSKVHIICAGTFGTPTEEWRPDYPLQYNFLNLTEDRLTVETRCRRFIEGEWEPEAIWESASGEELLPHYEIILPKVVNKRSSVEQLPSVSSTFEDDYTAISTPITPFTEGEKQNVNSASKQSPETSNNFADYRQQLEEIFEKTPKETTRESTKATLPVKRVLIVAVCPKNLTPIRLDEEVRDICEALRNSNKFQFVVEVRWAARIRDLREAMLEFEPHIIHFSGHGVGGDGLVFEDDMGNAVLVSSKILTNLFQLFSGQVEILIECVVLNACYSKVQADAMMPYVGCVIGMKQEIGDKAAIEFSKGFYPALANGRTIDFAFNFGCNAMQAEGLSEDLVPVLKKSELFSNTLKTDNATDSRHPHGIANAHERLLILAANPKNIGKIRLDEEVREIYAELKKARQQGQVVLEQRWAARFKDLQEGLSEFGPTIVHLSGYGEEDRGVAFESENGEPHFIKAQPLASLFSIFAKQVKCVFINVCYSQIQAQEIANYIDYAIGFSNAVQDRTSIFFSKGFYRGLEMDCSIEQAYQLGIIELQAQDISENQFPTLNKKAKDITS